MDSIEQQANAAVLARVMAYRDEVNLPLPEKAKHVENKLWADYEAAESTSDRMAVIREIQKQQAEQAKLTGAYIKDASNPADAKTMAEEYAKALQDELKYKPEQARELAAQTYGETVH
jgi:RPA family protein